MKTKILLCAKLFVLYIISYNKVFGQNIKYPAGTPNIINVVTDLGWDNTGSTDITDDFKTIFISLKKGKANEGKILYFPAGEYLVSAPIWNYENNGFPPAEPDTFASHIHIQGEDMENTRIILADGSSAFQNTSNPEYVISYYKGNTGNNDAFNNSFEDITINTGSGNPGAGGLEYTANNVGAIRNVKIISGDGNGAAGIKMTADLNGMTLLQNVSIEGFNYGIQTGGEHCYIVMDSIHLKSQKIYGVFNTLKGISIDNLTSNNTVTAIYSHGITVAEDPNEAGNSAHLTLTNSELNSPSSVSVPAIIVDDTTAAFLRNLKSTNYQNIATINGKELTGNSIYEYVSHWHNSRGTWKLWEDTPDKSLELNLEAEVVTTLAWGSPDDIYIMPAGRSDDYDSDTIQKHLQIASDLGKKHVIFDGGSTYKMKKRIYVPPGIQRINGNWSMIWMANDVRYNNGQSLFYFDESNHDVVMIEKFNTGIYIANHLTGHTNGGYFIDNVMDENTTLIIRDCFINYPVYRGRGNGKVYLENVNAGGSVDGFAQQALNQYANPTTTQQIEAKAIAIANGFDNTDNSNLQRPGFDVEGQIFVAKQIDSEFFRPNFKFKNCKVEIRGFKVGEKHGTHFQIDSSEATIIGGVVNVIRDESVSVLPDDINVLSVTDSKVTFVGHDRCFARDRVHTVMMKETRNSETKNLYAVTFPKRDKDKPNPVYDIDGYFYPLVNAGINEPVTANLALGKTVNASSDAGAVSTYDYYPENAVDGNTTSHWPVWKSGGNFPQWFEVDLNGFYNVNNVKFWTSALADKSYPMDYIIQYKIGEGEWTDIVERNGNYISQVDETFAPVTANKIRIYGIKGDFSDQMWLSELEIYGTEVTDLYTLTVTNGTGGGNYAQGSMVTISANAAPGGQVFDQWTGDISYIVSTTSASTSLTMPATALSITATYKPEAVPTYEVTVNNGTGSGNYTEGQVVSISANTPNSCQIFDKWTGDVSGIANVNAASTNITINSNASITATYKDKVAYALTLTAATATATACTQGYLEGEIVAISANTPPTGKVFDMWIGDVSNLASTSSATTTLTMPATAVNITATYKTPVNPTHTVTVNGGAGSGVYEEAASVTIIADAPASGKRFKEWTGDVSHLTAATTATATFSMPTQDVSFTATYEDIPTFLLTVTNGSGDGNYQEGELVEVVADAPAEGYVFDKWTGDVSGLDNVNMATANLTMPASVLTIEATYTTAPAEVYSVEFRVFDGNTPLEGAIVSLKNQNKTTDANGEVIFTDLAPISGMDYVVSKDGYVEISGQLDIINSDKVLSIVLSEETTNLSDLKTKKALVYPNPATDFVTIANLQNAKSIQLMNAIGQAIKMQSVNAEIIQLDVNDLTNGLYILNINYHSGIAIHYKLIIE